MSNLFNCKYCKNLIEVLFLLRSLVRAMRNKQCRAPSSLAFVKSFLTSLLSHYLPSSNATRNNLLGSPQKPVTLLPHLLHSSLLLLPSAPNQSLDLFTQSSSALHSEPDSGRVSFICTHSACRASHHVLDSRGKQALALKPLRTTWERWVYEPTQKIHCGTCNAPPTDWQMPLCRWRTI